MERKFDGIAGYAGLVVSLFTVISVFVAIGQYKGKIDQRLETVEKDVAATKTELTANAKVMQDFKTEFASFSGEMKATMGYIKDDVKDIKEKVNAKEK